MKKIHKWCDNHARALFWFGYVLSLLGCCFGWKGCLLSALYFSVGMIIESVVETAVRCKD